MKIFSRKNPKARICLAAAFCIIILSGLFVKAQTGSRGADAQAYSRLNLEYRLGMSAPASHLFEVTITAKGVTTPALDLAMPAWSPGRYVIYDFAKNVQEFQAVSGNNKPLKFYKTDKQTWRVQTDGASTVRVSYKLFANTLNGTFSQLNRDHGNYNGASLYMYIVGHKQDPIKLTIDAPPGWQLINGFSRDTTERTFNAPNYDILIDTPTEISEKFELYSFDVDGKTYRVMIHNLGHQGQADAFVKSIERIVRAQKAIFGPPDFQHYTFLYHIAPSNYRAMGDGMEHLNSTQIIRVTDQPNVAETYNELLGVTSHEFFHLWNVKRIRPKELGPWDYSREVYTTLLWVSEGITSYYGNLCLARSGVWTKEQYYLALSEEIAALQNRPGRRLMSAAQSSWDTWLFLAAPSVQVTNLDNTTISYYNKGELLGLLLDLEIRGRTKGRKSLDDVFRYLYDSYYLKSPKIGYYLRGRGITQDDFLRAVNRVSGLDFTGFFKSYVTGVEELDYDKALNYAGLKLEESASSSGQRLYRVSELENPSADQLNVRRSWLSLSGR